ncbi:MAG: hypothetical protein ACYCPS_01730 [Candidatus Saccharimonadales bacterium]
MKVAKLKILRGNLLSFWPFLLLTALLVMALFSVNSINNQQTLKTCGAGNCQVSNIRLDNGCGSGKYGYVKTSIDFGCLGNGCSSTTAGQTGYCGQPHSGITDLIFAIIKFLSDGVGLVVIASVIVGGIQFIASRGDPSGTQAATKRLTSSVTALLVFLFAYAILNYVIPNGFLK